MDRNAIINKLQDIMAHVGAEGGKGRGRGAVNLDPHAEFSTLGVNSVDLMEFVLRVEHEFSVDVLLDMNPEDLPTTLDGWATLVATKIRPAASSS